MNKNKLIWISALIFVIIIPAAFAQSIFSNLGSNLSNLFNNLRAYPYFIYFVNSFIIWIILFVLQAFIVPQKEGKEKAVIWIVTLVLATVIAWNWGGGLTGYIWNIGYLSLLFNKYLLVNAIIIGAVIYFGLGFAGVDPKTKPGQIGMVVLAIVVAGIFASNFGDTWLWDTSHYKGNYKAAYDYFLENEHVIQIPNTVTQQQTTGYFWWKKTQPVTTTTYTPQKVGGIFRPEEKNGYRLWVFSISTLLFIWFFSGFLMPNADKKLSWIMALIIAANLARYGTPLTSMIGIGEAFAIIMIGKQITQGSGTVGGIIGWLFTVALVEWIFCTVFHNSLSLLLSNVFNAASNLWIIGKLFSGFATMISAICPATGVITGTGGGTAALTIPGVTPGTIPSGAIPSLSPPSSSSWGWFWGGLATIIGSLAAAAWWFKW